MNLNLISDFVWGLPTILLILLTGFYLSFKLKFVQIFGFFDAVKLLFEKSDSQAFGVKPVNALMTALSATIGTGNIAGVATAIVLGGPGAIFWMWVTAIIGMATKYSEAYFAIKYRKKNNLGEFSGGPMYYIILGLGNKYKMLANSFAVFGCIAGFGIGNAVQINTIANVSKSLTGAPKILTGFIVAVIVALVLIGGIKRISNFAGRIVPFMALVYLSSALFCIFAHFDLVVPAIKLICKNAFSGQAVTGFSFGLAVRTGVSRGIFSNEAGLGSAAIAHAASKAQDPHKQGLIAMLGVFIDTIVVCSITAFVIIISGVSGYDGAVLAEKSFSKFLSYGSEIIGVCTILFAFTSIVGWSYYSEKCLEFIAGENSHKYLRVLWVLVIPVSASVKLSAVWQIADILNACMVFPNICALLILGSKYFSHNSK